MPLEDQCYTIIDLMLGDSELFVYLTEAVFQYINSVLFSSIVSSVNTYLHICYGIQKFLHDSGRPTPRLPFPLPISSGKLYF